MSLVGTPNGIGTRADPHAQAREARRQPLLLHSTGLFREVFEIVFAHREIRTVVEVGVESGQVSGLYAELGATAVHCVEPHPTDELRATLAEHDALHLVERSSPAALAELPAADLYVLDGDHNYATVRAELDWILAHAPEAVVVLHDLLWPCGRRDLYYQPSQLGEEDQLPSTEDGPTIWHDELTPTGFVGRGAFRCAETAGGEGNGVLTAVEDALADDDGSWHLELVPAVFGLGVLVPRRDTADDGLVRALRPYSRSSLLAAMENNRLALYTQVLHLQYEAAAHADRLAGTVSTQQAEIAALRDKLDWVIAGHAEQIARLRETNRRLTEQLAEEQRVGQLLRALASTAAATVQRRFRS
ncbi:class I SAM-dependent methyltransferase [Saccharopolyspora sp. CA-218241]|uniref:class I SAM-dependent methyltransferase n=1 Tax=Saccharopolyspora sp. CA-218241 TaxID=3240027 RepID=UPI003D96E527